MPKKKQKYKKPTPYRGVVSPLPLDHFGRLDIRVGMITDVEIHPYSSAKHMICAVNFGEVFSDVITAALIRSYEPEDLINKMVVVLCNVKPIWLKTPGAHESLLATRIPDTADGVELLVPPDGAEPGDFIVVQGYPRHPDLPYMNPDLQIFETIFSHIRINPRKQVLYKGLPMELDGRPGPYVHTNEGSTLVNHYKLEELQDRMVVLLCNVETGFSRGLDHTGTFMAARKGDKIELLDPPPNSKIGDKIFVPGYSRGTVNIIAPGDYRHPLRSYVDPKALTVFDDVAVGLKINSLKQATYEGIPFQIKGKDGFITTKTLSDCSIIGVHCEFDFY